MTSHLAGGMFSEFLHSVGYGPLDEEADAVADGGNPIADAPVAEVVPDWRTLAQLTSEQMDALYEYAAVPAEWRADLKSIADCESHFSPGAIGDGGNSLGLHQLWTGWFQEGENPHDPVDNTRVAVRVRATRGRFGGGGGWTCLAPSEVDR